MHSKIITAILRTMFFDWLKIYQDHDLDRDRIPFLTDRASIIIDTETSEHLGVRQSPFKHEGSYCTSIQVQVSGSRITVSGNPSRYNRIDNLFGFTSIDECVSVYNQVLRSIGLPEFTKCKKIYRLQGEDGSKVNHVSDGAIIQEIHITSNRSVGEGNVSDYLRGLSTQKYRNSLPRLHTNGMTIDWLSKKGNARFIYPSVYNKANEIRLHHLDKLSRKYGKDSKEVAYLNDVIDHCEKNGVARFEQKIKSAYLRKNKLCFWGLINEKKFEEIHYEFINLDERLQVEAMTMENISEKLLRLEIVNSTKAANTTTMYALQWMHGQQFDMSKSQVQTHRARLRKIGIDIAMPCDVMRFSPVTVRKSKQIEVTDLAIPSWYQMPGTTNLRLVA